MGRGVRDARGRTSGRRGGRGADEEIDEMLSVGETSVGERSGRDPDSHTWRRPRFRRCKTLRWGRLRRPSL